MSGQRGDTDCLARSGLFIDDDNWFGNTRTSPIRLRTTTCAFRAHQRSSMSAEQQSHKTRGACSERSGRWLQTSCRLGWRPQIRETRARAAIPILCFTNDCRTILGGTPSLQGPWRVREDQSFTGI